MLLKTEQARGIMHQDVAVQYKQFGSGAQAGNCRHGRGRGRSRLSETPTLLSGQGFHILQYFLDMTRYLDSTPFPPQYPLRVEHESAALYASNLLAVHIFHLHDAEQFADGFVSVAQ